LLADGLLKLFPVLGSIWRVEHAAATAVKPDTATYDHVIVAPAPGCLLATAVGRPAPPRAADRSRRRDNYHWIHIPVGTCTASAPRTDWLYFTEEDAGLNGRKLRYPRAACSAAVPASTAYLHARQSRDYDHWAALTADPAWRWDACLPTSSATRPLARRRRLAWRGQEWRVERQRLRWEILDAFGAAAREAGIPPPTTSTRGETKAWATSR